MVRAFPLTAHRGFLALTGKTALGALFLQPWVSNAKFRHLGLALPLMVLLVLLGLDATRREHVDPATVRRTWLVRLAGVAQTIGAILTIGTVIVYLD